MIRPFLVVLAHRLISQVASMMMLNQIGMLNSSPNMKPLTTLMSSSLRVIACPFQ